MGALCAMRGLKTVWLFLKKLPVELPYDPAIPLLDILQRMKLET
jgi:hypothetical protein